jgi:hypothetical protein
MPDLPKIKKYRDDLEKILGRFRVRMRLNRYTTDDQILYH